MKECARDFARGSGNLGGNKNKKEWKENEKQKRKDKGKHYIAER